MRLINLIRNLIKFARLLSTDDTGGQRFSRVVFHDKDQKVLMFSPYGLMHHPPNDSLVVLFSQQGMESNIVGMADHPKIRTLKGLAQGEVALGNYLTDHYLYFDQNGKATLVTDDLDVLVTDTTLLTTTDLDVQVSDATTIQTKSLTATVTDDCEVTATNITMSASSNVSISAGGNMTLAATGVLGLSGASISASGAGASMGISGGNMSITSSGLTHNGTNIGDTHIHSQAADSDGDSEQDTGAPH